MCKPIYRHLAYGIAKGMIVQLKANEHKGDRLNWVNLSNETLVAEIRHHTNKLEHAVKTDDKEKMKEYSADIANLAAMFMDANKFINVDKVDPYSRKDKKIESWYPS